MKEERRKCFRKGTIALKCTVKEEIGINKSVRQRKERKRKKKRKETVTADEWTELSEKAELISAVYCVFNKWREKKKSVLKSPSNWAGGGVPLDTT